MIPTFEAYKLMVSDLKNIRTANEAFRLKLVASDLGRLRPGIPQRKSVDLSVQLLWLQGRVSGFKDVNGINCVGINDGTGDAWIAEFAESPGGNHPGIQPGGIIGVLGQILSLQPILTVQAAKIMVIGDADKVVSEKMWPLEVKDAKAYLLGLYDHASW